ncbi:MAG: TIGR03619 family F420-dependent LLM class oxidoreductase [Thaumarchaeota archaeon]|nr:TIGR03619 family F420-dependent LLM class oxidoreductase [Nitrososphaerota archaeon]
MINKVMKLRFGPQLPSYGRFASTEAIAKAAVEAEAMGFDSIYMQDHIERDMDNHLYHSTTGFTDKGQEPGDPHIFETLTTAAYLAGITHSVDIGIMVVLLPQRNPVVTAKQIATVDQLSKGRLLVGIGVGNVSHKGELEILGVPYKERGRLTEDYIRAMKAVWTQPVASYQGKYVSFSGGYFYPKPYTKPHPPLIIGGGYHLQSLVMRRIAELGDGWVPILTPAEIKDGLGKVKEQAARVGRSNTEFKVVAYEFTSIAPTYEEAEKRYARGVGGQRLMQERKDTARIPAEEFRERSLVGSPDEIIGRVEEYREAGVTHVEMLFMCSTMDELLEQMKLFSREVLPSFQ